MEAFYDSGGVFWTAVVLCWISWLVFRWRVVQLGRGSHRDGGVRLPPGRGHDSVAVMALLRQRFVAGDITAEEYERLYEALLRKPLPTETRSIGASHTPREHPTVPRTGGTPHATRRAAGLALRGIAACAVVILAWTLAALNANPQGWENFRTAIPTMLVLIVGSVAGLLALDDRETRSGQPETDRRSALDNIGK